MPPSSEGHSTSKMGEKDGDPFDPKTYSLPMTIASMIKLRAFCAAFFEEHIRDRTKAIDQDLLAKFIKLITFNEYFFARAQAVIPELQSLTPLDGIPHMSSNIQRVLELTEHLRRGVDKSPITLPENPVWSKLAKDGLEQYYAKEAERLAPKTEGTKETLASEKQTSAVSPLLAESELSVRLTSAKYHH